MVWYRATWSSANQNLVTYANATWRQWVDWSVISKCLPISTKAMVLDFGLLPVLMRSYELCIVLDFNRCKYMKIISKSEPDVGTWHHLPNKFGIYTGPDGDILIFDKVFLKLSTVGLITICMIKTWITPKLRLLQYISEYSVPTKWMFVVWHALTFIAYYQIAGFSKVFVDDLETAPCIFFP